MAASIRGEEVGNEKARGRVVEKIYHDNEGEEEGKIIVGNPYAVNT